MRPLVTALVALGCIAVAGPLVLVRAEGDEQQLARRAQAVARNTMSPFCPGKTIDSCPSPRAEAWRHDIRAWLADGATPAEVQSRLQARAPGFDLAGRPGRGWDWLLPVGSLLVATLALLLVLRRIRPRRERPGDDAPTSSERDALDDRLDAELHRGTR